MKFFYKAYKNNRLVKGTIEAKDIDRAKKSIKSNNMFLISLNSGENMLINSIKTLLSKISFGDIVNLTRQFSIMLNAGLTLISTLAILKKQIIKPSIQKLIDEIDESIRSGLSFSQALKKRRRLFGESYIALVKAGEASGKLDEVLSRLADNLEKKRILIGKVKGALIYPAILVVGMFGVLTLMMVFVLPKMAEIYENFDAKLPANTVFLLNVSKLLTTFWPIFLIAIIVLIFLFLNSLKTKKGKAVLQYLILRLPVIKNIIKISTLVEITRTFATLSKAGVPMLETIEIVKGTSGLSLYQNAFANVYKRVEKGESLARAMEEQEIFPPILVQMITVGEESGHIDETLYKLSQYFEVEAEMAIKAMTTLIEPVVLVILGVAVGFMVFSIITPIYNLTSSMQ